jgi:hypothetical protein
MIFDLAWAGLLVWLGHHRKIKPWGLFALYVAGYSGYRIFEETIRIDSSAYVLGLRLNFFVALVMALAGLVWFAVSQRPSRAVTRGTAAVILVGLVSAAAAGCSQQPSAPTRPVSARHATALGEHVGFARSRSAEKRT